MADKYERSEIEFKAKEPNDPWEDPTCEHCALTKGWHWQMADGKIYCLKNPEQFRQASTSSAPRPGESNV